MSVKLINCFEVPPAKEGTLLAGFDAGRTHMAAQPGFLGLRMHRAVAADARIRFINYASWEGQEAFQAALGQAPMDALQRQFAAEGIRSHFALFDVVDERGTIENGSSGVLMISGFEPPAASEESFLAEFAHGKAHMTAQPGFLALRLHRAITPGARFRFVDVARWASAEAFWSALKSPGMQAVLARPYWKDVPYFAGIVDVVEQRGTI
jgi:quinol monooxygenase YgiN